MKKIVVIGAGISGISAARFLQSTHHIELLEKAPSIGGLIKCEYIDGVLFHKVGGHVFNAKNKEVFDWFWNHFDKENEFIKAKRNAKILFNEKTIGYPIENYLYELDKNTVSSIIQDLLSIHKNGSKAPFEYDNFEEFLKGYFGETLYELYFKPYNEKIWRVDLKKVALEWLEGKLPMPNINEILFSNIIKEEESSMVHSSFYYSIKGGSQFIADRLAQNLTIHCNTDVVSIKKTGAELVINDTFNCDKIVFTGDIRKLKNIIQFNNPQLNDVLHSVNDLISHGTSNLLCECDDNDLSWLYIPESFTQAHRIIYTGNFSPNNNKGRKTCVVEFSGQVSPEIMQSEIKKLPGNLKAIKHNYESNSYVIQEKDTRNKVRKVKTLLENENIYLSGRFAEWEYYNMDKAIEASMILAERIKSSH